MAKADDDEAMRARLDALSGDIEARRKIKPAAPRSDPSVSGDGGLGKGMSKAFRVVTELIAGIAVGAGLGWLLDKLFHTKPILMIIFVLLGTAGGFWNIIRESMPARRP